MSAAFEPFLCPIGHVATAAEIAEEWGGPSAVRILGHHGSVRRIRDGLYVCAHLEGPELTAAQIGAQLDCVSALTLLGMDELALGGHEAHPQLHLRMRRGHGRASARVPEHAADAVIHWSQRWVPDPSVRQLRSDWLANRQPRVNRPPRSRLVVSLGDAVRQAISTCLPPDDAVDLLLALPGRSFATHPALGEADVARIVARTSLRVQSELSLAGYVPLALPASRARPR